MNQAEKDSVNQFPLPFTPEEAEDQLVTMAVNLAMQRMRDGTASNQLISEIIKMGTTKERLQREKLQKENELLRARTESLQSQKNSEEFHARVLNALHSYAPTVYRASINEEDYDEYDEYDE